ncbi:MAG: hypothetical protein JXA23_03785 [Bacteroidales bacterium]|nr:hypothetical protein [Bacteroidales bacterium]
MKSLHRIILIPVMILFFGCRQDVPDGVYHPFKDHRWQRFTILKFELPVKNSEKSYNIVFFARYDQDFPYTSLDFNMVMNTPTGEERIREFQLMVKDSDDHFLGTPDQGIYEGSIILSKDLYLNKEGMLRIEVENLIPRMETPGLLGVGIRLQKN